MQKMPKGSEGSGERRAVSPEPARVMGDHLRQSMEIERERGRERERERERKRGRASGAVRPQGRYGVWFV